MFSTRSPYRPAPAIRPESAPLYEAAILVGHGSSLSGDADQMLARMAHDLREKIGGLDVRAGTLFGSSDIEAALANVPRGPILVVPMFMCGGYTVHTLLPDRLAAAGIADRDMWFVDPIGSGGVFSQLLAERAAEALAANPTLSHHVLVGHGTPKNPASRRTVERHVDWLIRCGPIADVRSAFLVEAPGPESVLASLDGPALIEGVFLADGLHAGEDILQAMSATRRRSDLYLGPAGSDCRLAGVVEDLVVGGVEGTATARPGSDLLAV